jgi:hypothetical protein
VSVTSTLVALFTRAHPFDKLGTARDFERCLLTRPILILYILSQLRLNLSIKLALRGCGPGRAAKRDQFFTRDQPWQTK